MRFDILTLFPEMFESPFQESIIKRAVEAGRASIALHNLREYGIGKHQVTDDTPYGGGGGMVMKPEPIFHGVEAILDLEAGDDPPVPVILLSPQGRTFSQAIARELAEEERLVLVCGRYEGVDERVRQHLVTDEISIGDYVLTGGELPAMVIVDAVTRLIPGVLGDPTAAAEDSFTEELLEHPHYTRPQTFRGWAVPEILLSGHHAAIAEWRRRQALERTWQRRPELLQKAALSEGDRTFLDRLRERDASLGLVQNDSANTGHD